MDEKHLENPEEDIDTIYKEYKQDVLNKAYEDSPERYNELLDEFHRAEREAKKDEGTYTVDDMLDELEEKREPKDSSIIK